LRPRFSALAPRPPTPTPLPSTPPFRSCPSEPPLPRFAYSSVVIGHPAFGRTGSPAFGPSRYTDAFGPATHVDGDDPTVPVHPKRSEEHTSELQSREKLVCRLLLETKNT